MTPPTSASSTSASTPSRSRRTSAGSRGWGRSFSRGRSRTRTAAASPSCAPPTTPASSSSRRQKSRAAAANPPGGPGDALVPRSSPLQLRGLEGGGGAFGEGDIEGEEDGRDGLVVAGEDYQLDEPGHAHFLLDLILEQLGHRLPRE